MEKLQLADLSYGLKHGFELPTTGEPLQIIWGCRAIVERDGSIDVVWDRASTRCLPNLPDWVGEDFYRSVRDYINTIGRHVCGSSNEVVAWDSGYAHVRWSTNASHGYVYITAWLGGEKFPVQHILRRKSTDEDREQYVTLIIDGDKRYVETTSERRSKPLRKEVPSYVTEERLRRVAVNGEHPFDVFPELSTELGEFFKSGMTIAELEAKILEAEEEEDNRCEICGSDERYCGCCQDCGEMAGECSCFDSYDGEDEEEE